MTTNAARTQRTVTDGQGAMDSASEGTREASSRYEQAYVGYWLAQKGRIGTWQ